MGVKPGKKSIGGNTSVGGGGGGQPKTPDNKRKSLPKPAPGSPMKKPAPAPPTMVKKNASPEQKKPMMKSGGGGISAQLAKVSDKSKGINKSNKKNRNKQNRGKGKDAKNKDAKPAGGEGQDKGGATKKVSKKNRRQRLQSKMSAKPRSPMSQSRALKAEQEMNKTSNRILLVKLPDASITNDMVKSWSSSIENAMFPKSIEPRSFLLVLKPDSNIKKEIETLKKVNFGSGKLIVEERKQVEFEGKEKEGLTAADFIDPYTIYLTNLDEAATRTDLQGLFPDAKTVMNPRKHNPRVTGAGTATKFAFVGFETADAALNGFKMCFNKKFVNDKFIVVRFRRVGKGEVNSAVKESPEKAATTVPVDGAGKRKAEEVSPKKGQPLKKDAKNKLIKLEPKMEVDEDDDDEEEDDESDDDELMEAAVGKDDEDESDDDDEDDGLEDDDDDGLDDEDDDDDDDDDE